MACTLDEISTPLPEVIRIGELNGAIPNVDVSGPANTDGTTTPPMPNCGSGWPDASNLEMAKSSLY